MLRRLRKGMVAEADFDVNKVYPEFFEDNHGKDIHPLSGQEPKRRFVTYPESGKMWQDIFLLLFLKYFLRGAMTFGRTAKPPNEI